MRSIAIACLLAYAFCDESNTNSYYDERSRIQREESLRMLGGNTTLSVKESAVNNCLMQHKFRELDYCFDNPQYFNFSHHYFSYKDKMKLSGVYKIIKRMPKSAALHVHDMALLDADYLINITYVPNLYVCFTNNNVKLKFANSKPGSFCDTQWQRMAEARNMSANAKKFDENLRRHFTIVVDNPDASYPSIDATWSAFMNFFFTVAPMLSYRPIWEQYFYDALKKFRDDNIMYVEVRSVLPKLYELDGTEYDQLVTAKAYSKVIKKFVKDYPDFIGAKLIFAPGRHVDRITLNSYLELARRIKKDMPDTFAGFDLVGQEDLGSPLIEFVPQLTAAAGEFAYFFHAGETDWFGTTTDENLVDAILLGAKRIGHAYALPKHPVLMNEVLERDIGLEVNVISNTVLSLVRDVRNHPLSTFLARDLPVVISSDDPGAWEAEPLSDDFYVAFVGAASRLSDLRLLKQLAFNSIKYSALDGAVKDLAVQKFNRKWDEFINGFSCPAFN